MQQGLRHEFSMLELAARCAVGCWFVHEQLLCEQVQNANHCNQLLSNDWFAYWQVARNSPLNPAASRQSLRALLFEARPKFLAAQNGDEAARLVQNLSAQAQQINICIQRNGRRVNVRPTSLISKFAFSCRSTAFVPYDRLGCRHLHTSEHDYVAYSHAFHASQLQIADRLQTYPRGDHPVGIAAANLPRNGKIMDQNLFVMRTTDWYHLMHEGFDPFKQKNPVHLDSMV